MTLTSNAIFYAVTVPQYNMRLMMVNKNWFHNGHGKWKLLQKTLKSKLFSCQMCMSLQREK